MNLQTVLLDGTRPRPPSPPTASVVFGWRAMLKIKHVPEQLFDVTLMPVITMLMFTYLFGGALAGSPGQYLQYVLPGVMAMSVAMTTMYTGTALNIDVTKGIFDRFRTLPIWRPAALVGALLGDLVRYALACAVMIGLGSALGYRPAGGVLAVLAAVGLLLVFSFSLSWVWTMLGLVVRSEKAVQGIGMMVIMPLVFLSSVFVRPETMPGLVRTLVELNPITHLVDAMRGVLSGNPDSGRIGLVLVSCAVLILVFGSLTMRRYNRR
ncbi:ABC transporter permease [Kibdelosporangium phytohabitans]|uniref:Transport permease protein n=1 Tax=Kibdelosporangium phytohabitans TaxID=860235 RepID=A0A0N9I5L8_9PSEU|nr:ABC transporter permease [Kibdelosporangium phytohabitans]ALG09716.1 ABC transporter [Kibdelosporangium phytohabitans]MBE1468925.1 ABC-2 type transport system permease protein [Kibdelosporangium phytohabitans]